MPESIPAQVAALKAAVTILQEQVAVLQGQIPVTDLEPRVIAIEARILDYDSPGRIITLLKNPRLSSDQRKELWRALRDD